MKVEIPLDELEYMHGWQNATADPPENEIYPLIKILATKRQKGQRQSLFQYQFESRRSLNGQWYLNASRERLDGIRLQSEKKT